MFSWFCLEIIGCCFGHSELSLGHSSDQNNTLWFRNKTMKTHVTQSLLSTWYPSLYIRFFSTKYDIIHNTLSHTGTHLFILDSAQHRPAFQRSPGDQPDQPAPPPAQRPLEPGGGEAQGENRRGTTKTVKVIHFGMVWWWWWREWHNRMPNHRAQWIIKPLYIKKTSDIHILVSITSIQLNCWCHEKKPPECIILQLHWKENILICRMHFSSCHFLVGVKSSFQWKVDKGSVVHMS